MLSRLGALVCLRCAFSFAHCACDFLKRDNFGFNKLRWNFAAVDFSNLLQPLFDPMEGETLWYHGIMCLRQIESKFPYSPTISWLVQAQPHRRQSTCRKIDRDLMRRLNPQKRTMLQKSSPRQVETSHLHSICGINSGLIQVHEVGILGENEALTVLA